MQDRIKLKLTFDAQRLQEDLKRLQERDWIAHFVKQEAVDLVVVASHGRHALWETLGSTTNSVSHHLSCDLVIVHGVGTGALRRAVREHLASSPYVREVSDAAPEEGGGGVSVACLVD